MEDFKGAIILIIFVVISGVKWLIEKSRAQHSQHDVNESLEEIYDEFREEIRQRQTTVQPPAPSATLNTPSPAPPPLPNAPVPQPRAAVPPAVQPQSAPVHQQQVRKAELTAAQKAAAERFQQLGRKKRRSSRSSGPITARALLSNPQSARQAVILHEVFGKPKSMQES